MADVEKSRDAILAERKARKLQKKNKNKSKTIQSLDFEKSTFKSKSDICYERHVAKENQHAIKVVKASELNVTRVSRKSEKFQSNDQKAIQRITVTNQLHLFVHLSHTKVITEEILPRNLHPAIIKVGQQFASHVIIGSNARCLAFLNAIKQVINDYRHQISVDFSRSFDATLNVYVKFLHQCRTLSVSILNAIKFLKGYLLDMISDISSEVNINEKLKAFTGAIDRFIYENIEIAGKAISMNALSLIKDNDVILTFGFSSLIARVLIDAANNTKHFRVIVVDSITLEGRELLKRLIHARIKCTYVLINSLNLAMMKSQCTKVLIGAHALLSNGYVMSRVGTAQVALCASVAQIPVLVCCETYKFSERAQIDSFVFNEICDSYIAKDANFMTYFMYDVTPANLVSGVVTELAILPCSSVPVVLRLKPS